MNAQVEELTDQKEFKYNEGDATTPREFDNLYKELFNRDWEVNGKTYNVAQLGWTREYSNTSRALGHVRYSRRNNSIRRLFISKKQLTLNLDKAKDFEDTIRHEIAHAIDTEIRGKTNHDAYWKMVARALGADDSRLHEGFLVKAKGKYSATCVKCGIIHEAYRKRTRKGWCKCNGGTFRPQDVLIFEKNH